MSKIIKEQINLLKPSATLAINEESNRLEKSGKKIFRFGFGQSPFPIPENIVNELKKNANKNTYLPMQGLEELRLATKENASIMDEKQSRMINLLLFASSCNSDTLKNIYSLADPDYKAYNSNGRVDRSGVGIGLNHQV